MHVAGKKVAILVHNYFEQSELEEPMAALKHNGVLAVLITADDEPLYGMQHVSLGGPFQADMSLDEARLEDYDALLLPGGVYNADKLRMNEEAQEWVVEFLDDGKPVGAICHAPWLLVSADAVEGRRLASYYTLQDDIQNAGGEWVDQEVVVDDNLVTSRKPADLPAFCDAFIALLDRVVPTAESLDEADTAEAAASAPPLPPDQRGAEEDARLQSLGYDKNRDQLSAKDQRDILADEDENDPDELHPSNVVPPDEQDGTQ